MRRIPPAPTKPFCRRYEVGGEVLASGGTHFRVWAPGKSRIDVVLCDEQWGILFEVALQQEKEGYFAGWVAEAEPSALYGFRMNDQSRLLPDPASRFQAQGPMGPSQILDPGRFAWSDHGWGGVSSTGQVIYELHFGTFTPEGSYAAAARQLNALAELGVTVIEIMPLAEFAGRFGWGYDGVCLFAPTRLYGTPDDLRGFIDRAHSLGLGVILDVVYNHFGPRQQSIELFSDDYFSDRHTTDWGKAVNFDGPNSAPVRQFFLANAAYWIEEFHFDGLRLDATQDIHDTSQEHILTAIARQVRHSAGGRKALLVAENEPQQTRLVRSPSEGGFGLDALWNDDFHHSAQVVMSNRGEAYCTDYRGAPQEFVSAAKYGYLYQGQWYKWQKKRRGRPGLDLPPAAFINYIQNHDQVANSIRGERCHKTTSPGCYRAMTALLLLSPGTPMLFQGQEFASSRPFCYFADVGAEHSSETWASRANFLSQFASLRDASAQACFPDPADISTFERCKLDFSERQSHAAVYALHQDLLRLRREDHVFSQQRRGAVDGAVLGADAFVLRYFGRGNDDRLLIVNFGMDVHLNPAPEPLLAPPEGCGWRLHWTSEAPAYGGSGTPPLESEENWTLPGCAAVVMVPHPAPPSTARS
jgi:maltooligosyltrehalose trehalohydrolase